MQKANLPTVHILHGIYNSDSRQGVGALAEYFEALGFKVKVYSYGFRFAIQTRWINPKLARELLPKIKKGDIVVGHSNGCAIIHLLAKLGAPIGGAVLINPALDADRELASQVKWVHVYHNSGDTTVWLSKLLPWHLWGEQGRVGFIGKDLRYTNYDGGKEEPVVDGHSAIFESEILKIWGPRIASRTMVSFETYAAA